MKYRLLERVPSSNTTERIKVLLNLEDEEELKAVNNLTQPIINFLIEEFDSLRIIQQKGTEFELECERSNLGIGN